LSASSMILRFRTNQYFGEMYHPSEESALSFFFSHNHNSTIYFISWRTGAYSYYYDYNSSHKILRIWHTTINKIRNNLTELLSYQQDLINQSQFVMTGLRDSYTLFESSTGEEILQRYIIDEMIEPEFDEIYSNEHYTIYRRILPLSN
jgi:hypothetical protein